MKQQIANYFSGNYSTFYAKYLSKVQRIGDGEFKAIVPSEETLQAAMDKYTRWLDDQIAAFVASVDQNVDQAGI